jgi:RHS repeat-associated protein
MPGRHWIGGDQYRYGHNGQEKDDEIFQGAYTAEYWEYDSRIMRRWNTDPITFPWQSTYACFNNNPIYFSDPSGAVSGTNTPGGGKTDPQFPLNKGGEAIPLDEVVITPHGGTTPSLPAPSTGNGPGNGQPPPSEPSPSPPSHYYNGVAEIRIYDFNNPRSVANNNTTSMAQMYYLGEPNWAEWGRQKANTGGANAGIKNSNMGVSTNGNISFSNNGGNATMNPNGTFGGGYNGYGVNSTGFSTPFGGASGSTSDGNLGGGIVHDGLNGPVIGTVNATYVSREVSITAGNAMGSGGIYSQTVTSVRNFTPANGGAATSQTVGVEKTKGFSVGVKAGNVSGSLNFNVK